MKVFICAFGGFSLAIPMCYVSSLALHSGQAAEYNTENPNTYISLPHLFCLPSEVIRHSIALKNPNDENGYIEDDNIDDIIIVNKIILLVTEVKCEAEIPDTKIFPIPKSLDGMRFSALFSGIQFDSGKVSDAFGKPILFLNIEALIKNFQKEPAA